MKLNQLFSFFSTLEHVTLKPDIFEAEVSSICFDTRRIKPNSVFVAIRGEVHDGHQFIEQAIAGGAIALVVEDKKNVPESYPYLVVQISDTRQALDMLAARFYGYPSQDLFCFGVTGTNGKTSVTYILEHILRSQNKKIAVMGTVGHRLEDQTWPADMTTPDPVTLQSRLKDFVQAGAQAVAMEVSSHALDQKRVRSMNFNTVIFTNLTLDHLDYHKTMQNYFEAKQKLFTDMMWLTLKNPKFAVINIDDGYGRRLKVADEVVAWTYGQSESDFQFKIHRMNFAETDIELKTAVDSYRTVLPVTGVHTVYNIIAAAVAALSSGINFDKSFEALKDFKGVPGRLEPVVTRTEKNVFIDYAHTPDALENVLSSLRQVRETSNLKCKIICVFGCGGDRDKSKRPLMAEIAARLSDRVIVTSDNPRTEDPQQIVEDIAKGFKPEQRHYTIEIDREKAIDLALREAGPQDVVLIAGKGHEDYQIIGTEKRPFSDYLTAKKYLRE